MTEITEWVLRKRYSLTRRQLRALRAVAYGDPNENEFAFLFWVEARSNWQSWRQTLGSLHARDLISYDGDRALYWQITEDGAELLSEVELEERRQAEARP